MPDESQPCFVAGQDPATRAGHFSIKTARQSRLQSDMKFSDALASSIHDIKNSLSMVLLSLGELLDDPDTRVSDQRRANLLRLETQRANNNLIQLLSLYKLDKHQLDANEEEYNLEDFLDEIVAENCAILQALGVTVSSEADPSSSGYFDESLVRGVLNSAIGNAQRYAHAQVLISGDQEDGYTVFRIEDDGDGFPDTMLEDHQDIDRSCCFATNRTQLGLHFASAVACLHSNGAKKGFIRLRNGHRLKGGCFELWLP
jgi:K+-sensing histidine kinase KdpD